MNIDTTMKELLIANHRKSVWYGDISLLEECAKINNIRTNHPQKTIQKILNALDKSTLFKKTYIIADLSGQKRKYRCFTLK